MGKYTKALSALGAGLVIAIPSLVAAGQDGHITLQEWLTVLGLFVPAVVVALSPANKLTQDQLVHQVLNDPNVDSILARLRVSPQALMNGLKRVVTGPPTATTTSSGPATISVLGQENKPTTN